MGTVHTSPRHSGASRSDEPGKKIEKAAAFSRKRLWLLLREGLKAKGRSRRKAAARHAEAEKGGWRLSGVRVGQSRSTWYRVWLANPRDVARDRCRDHLLAVFVYLPPT